MTRLVSNPKSAARHAYARLIEQGMTLSANGGWSRPEDIQEACATAVCQLFWAVAEASGGVVDDEMLTLDCLIELDKTYDGTLDRIVHLKFSPDQHIPDVLVASVNYDKRHGTRFGANMLEAMEALGYAFASCDQKLMQSELVALMSLVSSMYAYVEGELPEATSLVDSNLAYAS